MKFIRAADFSAHLLPLAQQRGLLLNLLRGAGLDGMAGMRSDGRRPILALRRSETVDLCSALGLSVIFGVMRVVNFAHGEFTVMAMYAAFILFETLHLDPLIALLPVAAAFFGLGYLLQRTLISPFIGRAEHEQFILLVGLATLIVNGLLLVFGPDARPINLPYSFDSYAIGPIFIDKVRVLAALAAVAVAAALLLFFRYTRTGTAIRACADNLTGAAVVGLNVKQLYAVTFGLGLACVGAAGTLMATIADASPSLAQAYTLLAFTIVIIGGLGSMVGALIGGILEKSTVSRTMRTMGTLIGSGDPLTTGTPDAPRRARRRCAALSAC